MPLMPAAAPHRVAHLCIRRFCTVRQNAVPQAQRRRCSCFAATPPRASQATPAQQTEVKATANSPPKPPADHRTLGTADALFEQSRYSPGSPLFQPNGAYMFNKLTNFLRAQYQYFGFREVITPSMYKKSLWETSGHWEQYEDDIYKVSSRGPSEEHDEEFGLKPMNCPGHCLLFASEKRSWRELPIRFADFSPLHRNEVSGALSGLTRVRRFHQDDGHIFCRPSQIQEEIKKTLDFVALVYSTFQLGPYKLVLSTRPDSYIGALSEWQAAEAQLKSALTASGQEWTVNAGDGAFYGPKIDIVLKDSDGKEHQTATIQLDFQLPKRFRLSYQGQLEDVIDPSKSSHGAPPDMATVACPILIHRAVFGSLERFLALLIEHYNGVYPMWLSPRPAAILPVSDDPAILKYVNDLCFLLNGLPPPPSPSSGTEFSQTARDSPIDPSVYSSLNQFQYSPTKFPSVPSSSLSDASPRPLPLSAIHALPIATDTRSIPVGKRIREAHNAGYNFILVAGKRDVQNGTVSVTIVNQRDKPRARELLREVVADSRRTRTTKDGNIEGLPVDGPVELRWKDVRGYFGALVGRYL